MTKKSSRVSLLAAILAACGACRAEPPDEQPTTPSRVRGEKVEITDDFRADTRVTYSVSGPLDWRAGQLTLREGASLRRDLDLGQTIELKLDLVWPGSTSAAPSSEVAVTIHFSNGRAAEVVVVRQQQETGVIWDAEFLALPAEASSGVNAEGQQNRLRLRRVRLAGASGPAELVVACRWGLLTARLADGVLARAYDESCVGEISSVSLSARRGKVDCRHWSCTGIARQLLTPDQQRRRALATHLHNEMCESRDRDRLPEALVRGQQARQLEKELGVDHPDYAECLNGLALVHRALAEYSQAEGLLRQALEIQKLALGEDHPDYARVLGILAAVQQDRGEYTQAEALYRQVLAILQGTFDEGHPQYRNPRSNLATLYLELGRYAEAEALHQAALELAKSSQGEQSRVFAHSLNNLGVLYLEMGEHARAEPLLRRAVETAKIAVGEQSPEYLKMLGNLAVFYRELADYSKARSLLTHVRDMTKKALGEKHPDYARALDSLAELLHDLGEFAEAEKLSQEALEIRQAALGEYHPDYALSLKRVADLCGVRGDWVRAEQLLRQALEIQKRRGENNAEYAASLGALAGVCEAMGENAKAEALHRESLARMEGAVGKNHSDYVHVLNNLATFYHRQRRFDQAKKCYLQVVTALENVGLQDQRDYATALNNLAGVFLETGEYDKAKQLHQRALEIRKNSLGERHPEYIASLHNLATVYDCLGDAERALPLAEEAFRRRVAFAEEMLSSYSENEGRELLEKHDVDYSWLLGILRRRPRPDAKQAHQAVWMVRGLLTRWMLGRWQAASDDPAALQLVRELRQTQAQLAQWTLSAPTPEQREPRRQRLADLDARKQSLERKLAEASAEFRRRLDRDRALPADLMRLVPPDCAVVEIAKTYVQDRRQPGKPVSGGWHYEAFVLRPAPGQGDYRAVWVHLGESTPIDRAVAQWRAAILARKQGAEPEPPENRLRKLVWEPIESELQGCRAIFIVPDGDLNFVPWPALPGREPDSFLLEDYAIATVASSRLMYELSCAPAGVKSGILLAGDVAYDRQPATGPRDGLLSRPPAIKGQIQWSPLARTGMEIQSIKRLWKETGSPLALTGLEANEQALRRDLPQYRYAHLATHGFFADPEFRALTGHDEEADRILKPGVYVTAARSQVTARNPLLLSGVVLAGANRPPQLDSLGLPLGEDGLLTAEEVVALDLRGTELVVLSACETGLGKVSGGEGVMGLTRAFHLAGARNVVASLWKVDDAATEALMVEFYKNLWQNKLDKLEALRQAQLAMLARYDPKSEALRGKNATGDLAAPESQGRLPPFYWAAFLLSGAGRSSNGRQLSSATGPPN